MKKKLNISMGILIILLIVAISALKIRGHYLDESYTQEVISKAMKKYNIPAISISVISAEQIHFTAHKGVRVYGENESITENDFFHIGSCSKSVLAYIAANLVEEGLINWNTKFFDIYPELLEGANHAYKGITLEELLSCRAGIQPYTSGMESYPDLSDSQNPMLEFIRYLIVQIPAARQNTEGAFDFLYSNASYTLATAMLEDVSGLTYRDMLLKYIKSDLDIATYIGWPYEKSQYQPLGHLPIKNASPKVFGPDSNYAINPLIESSGNLSMTSEGFAKYIQMHLQGMVGKDVKLSASTINYMHNSYKEFSMGAWNGTRLFKPYISLDGTAGTFYTRGVIIPDSNLAFTIMINSGSEEGVDYITMKLMKAYYNWWWMFWIKIN